MQINGPAQHETFKMEAMYTNVPVKGIAHSVQLEKVIMMIITGGSNHSPSFGSSQVPGSLLEFQL